jgi:UDP-N-acetylglucosamine--N-acetylmuramyl-(pentapeptide) pyrophosphoryl-undecaprenol N-acetylglucosamine transferase
MKVLVVAGSSGGHIFPALALLEYLKKNYSQTDNLLVLPRRNVRKDTQAWGCKVAYIDSVALKARIDWQNILAAGKFLKGAWQSFLILLRFEPDVVVGFGSIASIPLVIFCWFARLKVILHEQNVIPGQANRLLSLFCDRIAVSFPQSREYFKSRSNKVVFTGNPLRVDLVRRDLAECREFFSLAENKFTILVTGGSQGSQRLNRGFLKALAGLPQKSNLQVIHLAGAQDENWVKQEYADIGIAARVFPFLNEMEYAYCLADLSVCRAGATGIQELIHFQLPAVLVPYPFAYQHQMANALVLQDQGAAMVIEDKELDSGKLREILDKLLNDPRNLDKMRQAYDGLKTGNAGQRLAELVMDRDIGHG